ncbi:MAG: dihydroorotase [Sphingobacteriales bacterium 17-39-43]|uniref:dihydroorotase n=1 Tax=Daejeonella sp. TaxID=2805397 RepID=UPI000BD373BD|nr:dihydroorotase [Daejeonella sp.]OYY01329.1 MAG: dihydroorotase [Sphingobacteriia bacterium 35-40-5]OYZ30483.1 MAG: dihydroorotase [Sphingobacteriales bacterium 16-39-50]OZA23130.1 MAG: dihydroorotase [Sphingobacteriales bacterium 17-39-43]OZA61353.1 MAG: dihydroorotase [Sphingobacteriales bacterium 39-40-5]HQS50470.1 dihydroorotase [Daejeonella sp.]
MSKIIIKSATIVNEGRTFIGDVFIKNGLIEQIGSSLNMAADKVINAEGLHLFPGCIDDQVHFREPGLTHKADIFTESRAAIAGGITSFMEMPNTVPNTLTQELLEDKYQIAGRTSAANYSFFMGAGNDNLEQVLKTDPKNVCGIKVFMGSSTGNMLVDNEKTLDGIFSRTPMLVATHCEDEATIRANAERFNLQYGDDLTPEMHPLIRNAEACFISSSLAVGLAKKYNTRLHILHISTAIETSLFDNSIPLEKKRITSEACIHHLWFSDADYAKKGNWIKWNPAIKTAADRDEIFKAVLDDRIDVIATDHAPHTIEEKSQPYSKAPSGGPLVQHALIAMLEFYKQGKISLEKIVEKMAHSPAICFQIENRGFIREGYWADLVLVDLNKRSTVNRANVLSKCGWSPFEGQTFASSVVSTIVSGNLVYENGKITDGVFGKRLVFNREG